MFQRNEISMLMQDQNYVQQMSVKRAALLNTLTKYFISLKPLIKLKSPMEELP